VRNALNQETWAKKQSKTHIVPQAQIVKSEEDYIMTDHRRQHLDAATERVTAIAAGQQPFNDEHNEAAIDTGTFHLATAAHGYRGA
jgi:hypothetical protein